MTRIKYYLDQEGEEKNLEFTLFIEYGQFKHMVKLGDGLEIFSKCFGMTFAEILDHYKQKPHNQELLARDVIKHLIGLDDHESLTQKDLRKWIKNGCDLGQIIRRQEFKEV